MQTSYEVIKNAIEFKKPDRLPVEFSIFNDCDTHSVNWDQIGTGDNTKKETYDEWGCKWERSDVANMGLVSEHPLKNWEDLESLKRPNPNDESLYENMEKQFIGNEDKYIKTGIFMLLFERLHSLRGFENLLLDLYVEEEKISKLADEIVEYNICIIRNIADRFPKRIHGFSFSDDWGTESSTIISVEKFDEFFKPRYKKIFDEIKKAGWHIWMHSCGKINNIIPSLIDIGVDVLNMQQPTVNGIEKIGKRFAGRVCFSTLCDIQKTLPFKSHEEITAEAKLIIENWGTDKGGLIFSDYGDGRAIGVSDDKKKIMYEAFKKYDRWKK